MKGFERFLGVSSSQTLPYLGGSAVDARDRRLRITRAVEPGYWRFEIRGRDAEPVEPTPAPDLSDLPAVRGHATDGYLAEAGGHAELMFLTPEGDLPRFAPALGRRWPSGVVLFDATDFETDAEEQVRRAFEERRTLQGARSVPATLRGAFGYAVALRVARERDVPLRPVEVRAHLGELADRGDAAAADLIARAEEERARHRVRVPDDLPGRPAATASERIESALRTAGGTLLAVRSLGGPLLEVRYLLGGDRFASVVHGESLQVIDAGICLTGHDRDLTMESLPVVILEGIRSNEIFITRGE